MTGNRLKEVSGLYALIKLQELSTLDLQDNYIEDSSILQEIFEKMPELGVLYLKGNGCIVNTQHYRKTYIVKMPGLECLDDRDVTKHERRRAFAFMEGQKPAEQEEFKKIMKEKKERESLNHKNFQKLIEESKT